MKYKKRITTENVIPTIRRHMIGDAFEFVLEIEKSHGSYAHDALADIEILDFYSCFASSPLGFNHPVFNDEDAARRLFEAAVHKPANSDSHTFELASFTEAFSRHAMTDHFRHLFFIEGGALAVENALKAAFDWKTRLNLEAGRSSCPGDKILHFQQAFHGRSGYTLSLTNTAPEKTDLFPKFDWPRVVNPKVRFPLDALEVERVARVEAECREEILGCFASYPNRIAAIIVEPIQGEGGDNHFRKEFFEDLRRIADDEEALLIFDEVQTGFGLTGKMWAYQHFDVAPDILCFGKKSQVCGIMASERIDLVKDNVFHVSSRINSTWGGGLVDMARCEIILEVMHRDRLVENASSTGKLLLDGLYGLAEKNSEIMFSPRGSGLMCAFDCKDIDQRNRLLGLCAENHLLVIACGERSIRFRPPLTLTPAEAEEGLGRLCEALARL